MRLVPADEVEGGGRSIRGHACDFAKAPSAHGALCIHVRTNAGTHCSGFPLS